MSARSQLLVALTVGGVALGVSEWMQPVVMPRPVEARDRVAHQATVRAAFTGSGVANVPPEVTAFFQRAARAVANDDFDALLPIFDAEALVRQALNVRYDEAEAVGVPVALTLAARGAWAAAGWERVDVHHLDVDPAAVEFVVFARHHAPNSIGTTPAVWWLNRDPVSGQLRAYDYEDCRIGLRLSELVAVASCAQDSEAVVAAFRALRAGGGTVLNSEVTRHPTLPAPVQALGELAAAAEQLQRDDPAAALEHVTRADAARPGMPAVSLVRAVAHFRRGEWAVARAAALAHDAAVGPDPRTAEIIRVASEREATPSD